MSKFFMVDLAAEIKEYSPCKCVDVSTSLRMVYSMLRDIQARYLMNVEGMAHEVVSPKLLLAGVSHSC